MAISTALVGLGLVFSSPLFAASIVSSITTIVSTDGSVTVYESGPFSNDSVYYHIDLLDGGPTSSIAGIAVSYNDLTDYSIFSNALGNPFFNGSALEGGCYPKSVWPSLSDIPFETAFGTVDQAFIWIAGTNPITELIDVDGISELTTESYHAVRVGLLIGRASEFVVFGSGFDVIGGSLVPEPSAALLVSFLLSLCFAAADSSILPHATRPVITP